MLKFSNFLPKYVEIGTKYVENRTKYVEIWLKYVENRTPFWWFKYPFWGSTLTKLKTILGVNTPTQFYETGCI